MAVPDFSKIWASQSSLNPYEFSDEDYLDGWEFIGEIPPDRRMFDTLQKQNDTKLQWLYSHRLTREMTPAFNKRDVITVSGTYIAPVTGWYRITAKGGGGGGQGGNHNGTTWQLGGFGGGEGGIAIGYEHMTAGDTIPVVIGAGGAGGAAGAGIGSDGGDSTVTVNNNVYTGGGGKAVIAGGTGTIPGAPGGPRNLTSISYTSMGVGASSGGGNGGGIGSGSNTNGINGGGGAGGSVTTSGTNLPGGAGGDGFVWFEYWDPSLQ